MLTERFGVSQRHACRVVGQHRSTQRLDRVFGKRWKWTIEITAIEPPTRLAYRTTGMTTIDVEYVVSPTPRGGSKFEFTGSSPSRLAVLARHTLDREARRALSNLRTLLEPVPPP